MSPFSINGFKAVGYAGGIKKNGALDLALIVSNTPASWAGVFTTNVVKAACVIRNQRLLAQGQAVRAVAINSGNANAYTGEKGAANDQRFAELVAKATSLKPEAVLTLSTGVIGVQLPMPVFKAAIPAAASQLGAQNWGDAASAIITTDTYAKLASVERADYQLVGIAKGSGMIAPNMATMLSVIATNAVIAPADLQRILGEVVEKSFNRIVVDGDMSTNDSVLMLANGTSGIEPDLAKFQADLTEVAINLAQHIVRDGEGATKFVTIQVEHAANANDATQIARSIATSPLCKTAFHGADPNWGRLIAAAGCAGVDFDPSNLSLWLTNADNQPMFQLVQTGKPTVFDEPAAIELMTTKAWGFLLDMGQAGSGQSTIWTCDLSHDYVTINGDYRT